jgi:hypothetical protein
MFSTGNLRDTMNENLAGARIAGNTFIHGAWLIVDNYFIFKGVKVKFFFILVMNI